jgi:hypothetical protein
MAGDSDCPDETTPCAVNPVAPAPALLQTRVALLEPSRVFDAETLATALARLADRGWNAVALPGFLDGYPLFSSPVWAQYGLRRQHPDFSNWDPLEIAFDAAWRYGLDVILNLQPYLANANLTGRRRPPLPRKYPRWMARRHPDRQRRFEDEAVKRRYCCPANQEYRRFLCDTLTLLMEDYPFHGLMIDLRHYPFYTVGDGRNLPYCYCRSCREGALRELGFDPVDLDFEREQSLVTRWSDWQASQMDEALAYLRTRVLRARRTMRVMGLLSTESGLEKNRMPLIHWKTWVERSLVETLVLDRYSPNVNEFTQQLRGDLSTLPDTSLLLPMLPQKAEDGNAFLPIFQDEPVPGFCTRFLDWDLPEFDPDARVRLSESAISAEADPISSICYQFDHLVRLMPEEEELAAFLGDLKRILVRNDVPMSIARLMMVAANIRGLYDRVVEGQVKFGRDQDRVLRDLNLAIRLAYLAGFDLVE